MKTQEEWDKIRQKTTIYSRVVGWITPISHWNLGKQAEWPDRVTYKLKDK